MEWNSYFPKENRYFETDNGILYCGDCLKVMDKFPNKIFDAIITDPPYGVTRNKIDIKIPLEIMWNKIKKIRQDVTPIILFGQSLFFAELIISNKKEFRYDIVWDKQLTTGFLNAKRMPLRKHENIAIFYKKLPIYNPQFTKGQPLHSKGINYKNKNIKNQNYGMFNHTDDTRKGSTDKYPTSVIHFQKPHPSKQIHPTQKPLELIEYLIKTYTNKEDIALDFTSGSGTTLLACLNLNRRFVGIELNEEYCEITKNRLLEE